MNENIITEAVQEAFETVYIKNFIKEELIKAVNEITAKNDRWITLKPHGDDADDYKRLLIKDGEDIEDAMHRQGYYNKRQAKTEKTLKELQKEKDNAYSEAIKAKKAGDEKTFKEWTKKFWELKEQIKNFGKDKPAEEKEENNKKSNIKEFKNASNMADALKETSNYIKDINPVIASISLENLNKINSGLNYIYHNVCKFNNLKEVKKSRMRALAAADGETLVIGSMFNYDEEKSKLEFDNEVTNWQKDNEKAIEAVEKNRYLTERQKSTKIKQYQENMKFKRFGVYSSPENLIKETIIHELGHTIAYQAIYKDREEGGKITFGYGESQREQYIIPEYHTETNILIRNTLKKARENGDIYNISKYANKEPQEFFAECFVMYNIGEKQPAYIKEMIETIIKKL